MSELDALISRIEGHANISSLLGVSCLLRPADVFCLLEWVKNLQAERNVLKKTLEDIATEDLSNSSDYAQQELDSLYAPRDYTQADRFRDDNPGVTYPAKRQE